MITDGNQTACSRLPFAVNVVLNLSVEYYVARRRSYFGDIVNVHFSDKELRATSSLLFIQQSSFAQHRRSLLCHCKERFAGNFVL